MEYLKKHYEKIILSIVLLSLAAAAGYLIYEVSNTREELRKKEKQIVEGQPKKLKPLDTARYQKLLELGKTVEQLDLAKNHHVFNPVTWIRKPSGEIVKISSGNEIGVRAAVVTKISSLNLILDLEMRGDATRPAYSIGVTREYTPLPQNRKRQARTVSVGNKVIIEPTLFYVVKEIQGTYPDNQLVVDLTSGEETQSITLIKGKPFVKAILNTCDLRYPPDNLNYPPGRKEGDKITIAGEEVKVFSIKSNEVTLEVPSSQQRTTLPYRP